MKTVQAHVNMLLSQLSEWGVTCDNPQSLQKIFLTGLTADSREVRSGYLFAAFAGVKTDGADYIPQAVGKGAVAVLVSPKTKVEDDVVVFRHKEPRLIFAKLAAAFYGAQPQHVVAVTGTNGKTSVAHFCQQLWHGLGNKAASLGTLGIVIDNSKPIKPSSGPSLTTPDPVFLHSVLAEFAAGGVNHVAMEASSHGLDQYRLDGIRFEAAGFTSFSRDHMDYHKTEKAYLVAKMRLFDEVLPDYGVAVLNADIPEYKTLKKHCDKRELSVMSYGEKGEDIHLQTIIAQANGSLATFVINDVHYKSLLPLAGAFQVYNVLCALGLVMATGADVEKAVALLPTLKSVPGRMENVVKHPKGAGIYVDYAHTPDALEKALSSLKPHVEGKLFVVFGCGGDRDKGKRPLMGKAADQLADYVIVTDDNPRSEDPVTIRAEVLKGCKRAPKEIGDRREAIYYAINQLQKGDVLLIAGKGHENTQQIGEQLLPFDDTVVAFEAVSAMKESV
jgi:UDP-N-acetylmuramoyl-L-alanyl-D-glutamate--2,6-diaminopimelate ligase